MVMVGNRVPPVYELTVISTPLKLQPHKGEDGNTTTDLECLCTSAGRRRSSKRAVVWRSLWKTKMQGGTFDQRGGGLLLRLLLRLLLMMMVMMMMVVIQMTKHAISTTLERRAVCKHMTNTNLRHAAKHHDKPHNFLQPNRTIKH